MAIATGVAKVVAIKKQTAFGTISGTGSGRQLRRVQSTLSLTKDTYESAEIRTDYQRADFRHGVRRVAGNIDGELSPGSYSDIMAAILHKDFAAVTALTGLGITIGAVVSGVWPVTRAAGDFLASGLKIGHVFRLSVGGLNAANINRNMLVVALTATIASVVTLNDSTSAGTPLVPEGPIAGCTLTVIGKTTATPQTGHTDDCFTIEHWHADVAQSEVFESCKCSRIDMDMPPTGMATIRTQWIGRDMIDGTSQYFTTPTAAGTSGVLAAVNGALVINGVPQALLTGLTLNIDGEYSSEPVVGSNTVPEIFKGRVIAKGQVTAFFANAAIRDMFVDETEATIIAVLTTNNSNTADFIAVTLMRVKFGGADKSDGPKGLIQTMPFEALLMSAGGSGTAYEKATMLVQDSLAA